MSATPITVAATLRGKQAVQEVRELLDRLEVIDRDVDAHQVATPSNTYGPYNLTHEEVSNTLQQRRQDVLRQLENKGIRVAPDPEPSLNAKSTESQEQPA
jgi:hypothetical protein